MSKNKILTNIFQCDLNHVSRQSACPFLTTNQLSFLKKIQTRSENNLINFAFEEMNEMRTRIIVAGYTDDMNTSFKNMLRTPENINRQQLFTILSCLKTFYQSRYDETLETKRNYNNQLKSLSEITLLSERSENQELNHKNHQTLHKYANLYPVLKTLKGIVNNIDAILAPPNTNNVLAFVKS